MNDRSDTESEPTDTGDEHDEKAGARGIAVSKLTAGDLGKPELADHEPAGEDPKQH